MRHVRDYWWLVLRKGLPALERGEVLSSVLGVFAAAIFGVSLNLTPAPWWITVLAAIAFLFLVVTPTRIWIEDRVKIEGLEETLRPKLKVELDEARLSPDRLRRFVRLRVINEGGDRVLDCGGKLLHVEPLQETGVELPEPGQNLMWCSRGGDAPGPRRSIDPKSHEYLDVAFTDFCLDAYADGTLESTPTVNLHIQRLLEDPTPRFYFVFLDWQSWPLPQGSYDVHIEVSAANVATPTPVFLRILYEDGLKLRAEAPDTRDSPPQVTGACMPVIRLALSQLLNRNAM